MRIRATNKNWFWNKQVILSKKLNIVAFLLLTFISFVVFTNCEDDIGSAAAARIIDDEVEEPDKEDPINEGPPETQVTIAPILSVESGDSEITLSWNPVSNAMSYNIYRDETILNNQAETTYTDTTVINGQSYTYQVTALNASGSEGPKSNKVIGTPQVDSPSEISTITKITPGSSEVILEWDMVLNADTYNIYRDGIQLATGIQETTYTDTTVTNGQSYTYQISAVNDGGEGNKSPSVSVAAEDPIDGATSLRVESGDSEITLSWGPVSNAISYNIYRDGIQLATGIRATTYTDTTVTNGQSYTYEVTALNELGSEGPKSSAILGIPQVSAPMQVTNLRGVSSDSVVKLLWDMTSGATYYNIYRNSAKINSREVNETTYTDTGLTNGQTYEYQVAAVNPGGEGPKSKSIQSIPAITEVNIELLATHPRDKRDISFTTFPELSANLGGSQVASYEIILGEADARSMFSSEHVGGGRLKLYFKPKYPPENPAGAQYPRKKVVKIKATLDDSRSLNVLFTGNIQFDGDGNNCDPDFEDSLENIQETNYAVNPFSSTLINSPTDQIRVHIRQNSSGQKLQYKIVGLQKISEGAFTEKNIINWSNLGMKDLVSSGTLGVKKMITGSCKEIWKPKWGQKSEHANYFNQVTIQTKKGNDDNYWITFRVYDDGIGLRYTTPGSGQYSISRNDESTQFVLADNNASALYGWLGSIKYEILYLKDMARNIGLSRDILTPITFKLNSSGTTYYVSINEANQVPTGMSANFLERSSGTTFVTKFMGTNSTVSRPFDFPWRTIQVVTEPGRLIQSSLTLNLNPPFAKKYFYEDCTAGTAGCEEVTIDGVKSNKKIDLSWMKTGLYVGYWWEFHSKDGPRTGNGLDFSKCPHIEVHSPGVNYWGQATYWGNTNATHGCVTTARAKEYMDFAQGIGAIAVLTEGWNAGATDSGSDRRWVYQWRDGWRWKSGNPKLGSNTVGSLGFDLAEVARYGSTLVDSAGNPTPVEFLIHLEVQQLRNKFEREINNTVNPLFAYYKGLGIHVGKSGYVDNESYGHYDKSYSTHFRTILQKGAQNKLAFLIHEGPKPTGEERPYPNLYSRETIWGMEKPGTWNGQVGMPPGHPTAIAFTRLLGGPADFTPGITYSNYTVDARIELSDTGTRQLALMIMIHAPMVMAADMKERYEAHPDFTSIIKPFFKKLKPMDWQEIRILHADPFGGTRASEVGGLVLARKQKNTDRWFIVGVSGGLSAKTSTLTGTDLNGFFDVASGTTQNYTLDISPFMESGTNYTLDLYTDHSDAGKSNHRNIQHRVIYDSSDLTKDDSPLDISRPISIMMRHYGGFVAVLEKQ